MPDVDLAATGRRDTDEIEITPAMIEAGVVALGRYDSGDERETVVWAVYSAMDAAGRARDSATARLI